MSTKKSKKETSLNEINPGDSITITLENRFNGEVIHVNVSVAGMIGSYLNDSGIDVGGHDCDNLNDSRDFDICSVFMCKESA